MAFITVNWHGADVAEKITLEGPDPKQPALKTTFTAYNTNSAVFQDLVQEGWYDAAANGKGQGATASSNGATIDLYP
jgi:hypothetical protein